MVKRAEVVNEIRLQAGGHAIEDMYLEPAFPRDERGEQPDRTGAGHQHRLRIPGRRSAAEPIDLVPGFRDDTRRLQQDAQRTERRIERDHEPWFQPEPFRTVTVAFFDPTLRV